MSTKKFRKGLLWLAQLDANTIHELSSIELRQNLCNENTPAGSALRACLQQVDSYAPRIGKCKSYVVNQANLNKLLQNDD
jgi:hypothetical protein